MQSIFEEPVESQFSLEVLRVALLELEAEFARHLHIWPRDLDNAALFGRLHRILLREEDGPGIDAYQHGLFDPFLVLREQLLGLQLHRKRFCAWLDVLSWIEQLS